MPAIASRRKRNRKVDEEDVTCSSSSEGGDSSSADDSDEEEEKTSQSSSEYEDEDEEEETDSDDEDEEEDEEDEENSNAEDSDEGSPREIADDAAVNFFATVPSLSIFARRNLPGLLNQDGGSGTLEFLNGYHKDMSSDHLPEKRKPKPQSGSSCSFFSMLSNGAPYPTLNLPSRGVAASKNGNGAFIRTLCFSPTYNFPTIAPGDVKTGPTTSGSGGSTASTTAPGSFTAIGVSGLPHRFPIDPVHCYDGRPTPANEGTQFHSGRPLLDGESPLLMVGTTRRTRTTTTTTGGAPPAERRYGPFLDLHHYGVGGEKCLHGGISFTFSESALRKIQGRGSAAGSSDTKKRGKPSSSSSGGSTEKRDQAMQRLFGATLGGVLGSSGSSTQEGAKRGRRGEEEIHTGGKSGVGNTTNQSGSSSAINMIPFTSLLNCILSRDASSVGDQQVLPVLLLPSPPFAIIWPAKDLMVVTLPYSRQIAVLDLAKPTEGGGSQLLKLLEGQLTHIKKEEDLQNSNGAGSTSTVSKESSCLPTDTGIWHTLDLFESAPHAPSELRHAAPVPLGLTYLPYYADIVLDQQQQQQGTSSAFSTSASGLAGQESMPTSTTFAPQPGPSDHHFFMVGFNNGVSVVVRYSRNGVGGGERTLCIVRSLPQSQSGSVAAYHTLITHQPPVPVISAQQQKTVSRVIQRTSDLRMWNSYHRFYQLPSSSRQTVRIESGDKRKKSKKDDEQSVKELNQQHCLRKELLVFADGGFGHSVVYDLNTLDGRGGSMSTSRPLQPYVTPRGVSCAMFMNGPGAILGIHHNGVHSEGKIGLINLSTLAHGATCDPFIVPPATKSKILFARRLEVPDVRAAGIPSNKEFSVESFSVKAYYRDITTIVCTDGYCYVLEQCGRAAHRVILRFPISLKSGTVGDEDGTSKAGPSKIKGEKGAAGPGHAGGSGSVLNRKRTECICSGLECTGRVFVQKEKRAKVANETGKTGGNDGASKTTNLDVVFELDVAVVTNYCEIILHTFTLPQKPI